MMRWLGLSLLAAAASLACGESRLLDEFSAQSTRLRVSPQNFRGSVPCLKGAAGALQTYAVSFHEVREGQLGPDAGLLSQTSAPVPCDRSVLLDALPGRAYVADIYGFDRALSDPEAPLDEARWLAHCGRGDGDEPPDAGRGGPTRAVYGAIVTMRGCSKFSGGGVSSAGTSLLVDQASALGSLRCGTLPGQVSYLEGVLEGGRATARCGEPLIIALASSAPRSYTIELTAFEARPEATLAPGGGDELDASIPAAPDPDAAADAAPGDGGLALEVLDAGPSGDAAVGDAGASDAGLDLGVARWRSQCIGRSLPGVTAVARCEPLLALPRGP